MYLILLIPAIMFIIISQTQQFQGLWVIACQAWQLPSMRSLNCPRNAFYEHIFWIPPIILHSFHSVNVACPPQVIVDSKKNQGHFTLFSLIVTQNLGSSNKFKVLSVQLAVSFKAKTKKWEEHHHGRIIGEYVDKDMQAVLQNWEVMIPAWQITNPSLRQWVIKDRSKIS